MYETFSSYGSCVPSARARYETSPPLASTRAIIASTSAGASTPRTGVTPMPSCEAVKFRNDALGSGTRSVRAQSVSAVASPVCSVCTSSGGSAKL